MMPSPLWMASIPSKKPSPPKCGGDGSGVCCESLTEAGGEQRPGSRSAVSGVAAPGSIRRHLLFGSRTRAEDPGQNGRCIAVISITNNAAAPAKSFRIVFSCRMAIFQISISIILRTVSSLWFVFCSTPGIICKEHFKNARQFFANSLESQESFFPAPSARAG